MKKKLYFFQVNYSYGRSAHIPYTAGQLAGLGAQLDHVADLCNAYMFGRHTHLGCQPSVKLQMPLLTVDRNEELWFT